MIIKKGAVAGGLVDCARMTEVRVGRASATVIAARDESDCMLPCEYRDESASFRRGILSRHARLLPHL